MTRKMMGPPDALERWGEGSKHAGEHDEEYACRNVSPYCTAVGGTEEHALPCGCAWASYKDYQYNGTRTRTCAEMEALQRQVKKAEEAPAEPDVAPRASALNEARDLITGDRNAQYGPPTQDFQRTAAALNAYGYRRVDAADTILDILPSDVALIIAQVKMSRLMHSRGKRDNWVDLAGYAGCGYECAVEEADNA